MAKRTFRWIAGSLVAALGAAFMTVPASAQTSGVGSLIGRAVLPATTFQPGPTSGTLLGPGPINGIALPFSDKQPVQGFSAIHDNKDGTFWAMSDNGYGSLENSADYNLRVHLIKPEFVTASGGSGKIKTLDFIELSDPDKKVPFAIVNFFTPKRVLTGADFDIESMQLAKDGTIWFGDEFGPFLIHTDAKGKVLEPPIALPDLDNPGKQVRSPQNPFNEESSTVRVMNALRAHAQAAGAGKTPVVSPWYPMLDDGNPATGSPDRLSPPPGSGLAPASNDIHNVASLHAAGYKVVPYTVNDKPTMAALLKLGVDGIISDRSDLLYQAIVEFDSNGDGTPGDLLLPDGRIDPAKIDAQGHRGSRGLRPENTLPAMETGLDNLMTTLETDTGITFDGLPVLNHDPHIQSAKCRKADGTPYGPADEVLIKDMTAAQIASTFICDKLLGASQPAQSNDRSLSPVAAAFKASRGLPDEYVMPQLSELFDFVGFYIDYYSTGAGSATPGAARKVANASAVRFNIETKLNPRAEFASLTFGPAKFVDAVGGEIASRGLEDRADIQSFDWRSLLLVHERFPKIRSVALFGDFPKVGAAGDGTNLQPDAGGNTPWLAGLPWPYRVTKLDHPFRAQRSGGFEGMAMSPNGNTLYPLLELPLTGAPAGALYIHELDVRTGRYTGNRWTYKLDPKGTNIGDFFLFDRAEGLVIERDGSQGNLNGFKAIYSIMMGAPGTTVGKSLVLDLMKIKDPHGISLPGEPGDVGLGDPFAFPFTTIEDVVLFNRGEIGVLNDNNFPFSVGRHVGSGKPDDNEFIRVRLDRPL